MFHKNPLKVPSFLNSQPKRIKPEITKNDKKVLGKSSLRPTKSTKNRKIPPCRLPIADKESRECKSASLRPPDFEKSAKGKFSFALPSQWPTASFYPQSIVNNGQRNWDVSRVRCVEVGWIWLFFFGWLVLRWRTVRDSNPQPSDPKSDALSN